MSNLITKVVDGEIVDTGTMDTVKTSNDAMGKDAFLKLLVTQMQYQDPLNPQADTAFVAQLAQFSALEQMQNMNTTTMNTQAFSLLGKEVVVAVSSKTGETETVQGYVDYVVMQNNKAHLSIDGALYPIDNLRQVIDISYSIQQMLPSVEKDSIVYDLSNPKDVKVKADFGKDSYKANSIAVGINGKVIDSKYLSYKDGVLTIKKEAFDELELGTGKYNLIFMFDDPLYTTITDKITFQVVGIAPEKPAAEEGGDGSEEEAEEEVVS